MLLKSLHPSKHPINNIQQSKFKIEFVKKYQDTVRMFVAGNVCFHEHIYTDSLMSMNPKGMSVQFVKHVLDAYIDLLKCDARIKPHKSRISVQVSDPNLCRSYLMENDVPSLTHKSSYIRNKQKFLDCRLLQYGTPNYLWYDSTELYPETVGLPSPFFHNEYISSSYGTHRGHMRIKDLVDLRRSHENIHRQLKY